MHFSNKLHSIPYLTLILSLLMITIIYLTGNLNKITPQTFMRSGFLENEDRSKTKVKKLPGLLIVGVQKCGTQAVASFLAFHPNLTRAGNFEIHFFDQIHPEKPKSIEDYLKLLPETSEWEIAFEKTPAYFGLADPMYIHNMLPNVKILIQMCDPVERSMSAFIHNQHTEHSIRHIPRDATFESVILDKTGNVNISHEILQRGIYIRYLRDYLKHFSMNQILIIETQNLKSRPAETLKKVEEFLKIPPFFTEDQFYINPKTNTSCVHIEHLGTERMSPKECLAGNKHRVHPAMNQDTRRKLEDFFAPYNKELSIVADMNFSWIIK
ncbi:unnamed protein product [Owenia fusiformis]|uniref:Uncharacterized protein n=1 Tax=Owenia fusiformis TaxID=6347 RepID=A0A8J1Y1E7_OWEFU|nr:unnamed protein product [Owenia fusiformis]